MGAPSRTGVQMNGHDLLGWLAAGLMLLTFWCADARALRRCAIGANLAFIAYGLAADLAPVLALHLVLLPVNLFRLLRLRETSVPTVARGPNLN
ncbi:MAG: hypothetical protein IPG93_10220 [Burkholderiales bacterium]|nr:hypothetical protein [Burkholderiales bacterium]